MYETTAQAHAAMLRLPTGAYCTQSPMYIRDAHARRLLLEVLSETQQCISKSLGQCRLALSRLASPVKAA